MSGHEWTVSAYAQPDLYDGGVWWLGRFACSCGHTQVNESHAPSETEALNAAAAAAAQHTFGGRT